MNDAAKHEPEPLPNTQKPLFIKVIGDIASRASEGLKRYGTYLQPFNGRNSVMDAYQEAIDLVMYLRQLLEEREWIITRLEKLLQMIQDCDEEEDKYKVVQEILDVLVPKRKEVI